MKKLSVWLLVVILVLSLCGCQHTHQWVDATCTTPKTCSICKETEGEPTPHQWVDATCTSPKKCSVCGTTNGKPLGHNVSASNSGIPKCTRCGQYVVDLTAKDVQYDMTNNVGKYFTLKGYAELDDYYNYGFDRSIEKDYFCLEVSPTGGSYSDRWYIYCHRNSFQKVLDKAKSEGGLYVDMICIIPNSRFKKNQQKC